MEYVKITGANGVTTVIKSDNARFYEERGYEIGKATKKEIELYFPETIVRETGADKSLVVSLKAEIEKLQKDLTDERAEKVTIINELATTRSDLESALIKIKSLEKKESKD